MRNVIRGIVCFLVCSIVALQLLMAPQGIAAQEVLDGQLRLNADGSGMSELRLNLPEDLTIEDVVSSFEEAGYTDVQYQDLGIGDYRISASFSDLNEVFIDTWHPLSDGSVEVLIYAWIDFLPPDLYLDFALGAGDYTMTVHLPGPIRETDGRRQSADTVVFGEQGGKVTYQPAGASPTESPPTSVVPTESPPPSPSPTMHSPFPPTGSPLAKPKPTDASAGGVSWWVWLIVGIGAVLLIVVLLLVFVLVRRPRSPSINRGRFCTNCGARAEGPSRFCSGCGKPLTG